jgi:hypothetical protein
MDCYAYSEVYEAADTLALEQLSDAGLQRLPSAALTASAIRLDYLALQYAGILEMLHAQVDVLTRVVAAAREAGAVVAQVEFGEELRSATANLRSIRRLATALTRQQQRVQDERRRRAQTWHGANGPLCPRCQEDVLPSHAGR